jgi:RHS repeat-associated protein
MHVSKSVWLPLAILLVCRVLVAQVDPTAYTGAPSGANIQPVRFGFVNLDNGNLHLEIPLYSLPARGHAPAQSVLVYDSTFWKSSTALDGMNSRYYPTNSGFANRPGSVPYGFVPAVQPTSVTTQACPPGYPYGSISSYQRWQGIDAHGTSIEFLTDQATVVDTCVSIGGLPDPNVAGYNSSSSAYGLGNNGYFLSVTNGNQAIVYSPDGTSGQETPNGNVFIVEDPNTYLWKDNLNGPLEPTVTGTCPLPVYNGSNYLSDQPYAATPSVVCTATIPVSYGANNQASTAAYTYTFNYIPVCTQFIGDQSGAHNLNEFCGGMWVLGSLGLPDGTSYTFNYDQGTSRGHYGKLTSLTLPTGGAISYAYYPPVPQGSGPNSMMQVQSVTDGGGTTSFSWGALGGYPLTVTYPAHVSDPTTGQMQTDTSVHSLSGTVRTRQDYSGSTLVRSVSEDVAVPAAPSFIKTTYNETGDTYEADYQYTLGNLVSEKDESVNGTLVRKTKIQYLQDTASIRYVSQYHMISYPTLIQVLDPQNKNAVVAQTSYAYDEYSAGYCSSSYPAGLSGIPMLSSFTGVFGHDDTRGPNYYARGNVTSVTRTVSGTQSVTTHSCYDTLGNVTQTIDGNGKATRFSYADNYADNVCIPSGTNTYAFPTLVTDALGHQTKTSYSSCLRKVQAIADANDVAQSRSGTVSTFDTQGRPLCTSFPDGGQKCLTYPNANTITLSQLFQAGQSAHSVTTTLDGFARPIRTVDQQSGVTTDTTYDAFNRVNSVSNPYISTSDSTYGVESYSYDAFGRTTVKVSPGGGVSRWTYKGLQTDNFDESGVHHQLTNDALGNLQIVNELGTAANPTNLETDYNYDLQNNLTRVDQWGGSYGSSGERVRTFAYDSLSRLVTSTNPETGTICYGLWSGTNCINGYDANGNLTAKTDARGITISYGYDALNRMTSKSSSDGSIKYSYNYDGVGLSGASNPIGRLTQSSNNNANAASHYDYDAMGRVIDNYVCSPSNCSYTLGAAATYDFAGNMVTSRIATGMTAGMSYDAAGRLATVTATQPGSSTPATLFSNATYGPIGLTEAMLGNGLREEVTYDKRSRINSYNVGQSTSPASGGSPPSDYIDVAKNNGNGGSSIPQGGIMFAGGWAIDNEDGAPVAKVEVLLDGNVIGLATLGGSRPDVAAAYNRPDFTNSGWNFTGSIGYVAPGTHMINAMAYDSSGNSVLTASSVAITVTSDNPPFGSVDAVKGIATGTTTIPSGGLVTVGGWAADIEDGSPVATVRVLLDGVPIGNATLGSSRPDVAAAYNQPAYAKSGWNFTGSVRTASVGTHTISVAAYDSSGNETILPGSTSITVTANPDSMTGSFDGVSNATNGSNTISLGGNITVVGWAAEPDQNPGAPVSRVEIEIDGQYLGLATLGGQRPDVASASNRTDFLNSGYSFTGPVTNVDPGEHSIGARMFTKSGGSYLIPLFAQSDQIIVAGTTPPLSTITTPTKYSYALNYAPNGNVIDASDSVNGNWAYSYDSLNRLTSALSPTTGLSWSYDSFGNRWQQTATRGSAPQPVTSFSTATNRADGVCYDAAGNVLDDGPCPQYGAHKYAYDAEGKLISSSYGTVTYIYDAEGRRVGKASSGTITNVYYYDVAGHLTTEISANSHSDIYAGNRHLATYQGNNVFYNHASWLGTEAARSDATGTLCETISSLPFGDAQQTSGTCSPSPVFFTGKERDTESGLDYFGARHYSSTMGRFMSPDPSQLYFADPTNPQSLNLYTYVVNNPLKFVDPSGLTLQYACAESWQPWQVVEYGKDGAVGRDSGGNIGDAMCQVYDDGTPSPSVAPIPSQSQSAAPNTVAQNARCAASNAVSIASLAGISNSNWLGQTLLGNDFSTASNLLFGPNRVSSAGQAVVSNPLPYNLINKTAAGIGATDSGTGRWLNIGSVDEFGNPSAVFKGLSVAETASAKAISEAAGVVTWSKLAFDAGAYAYAYAKCAGVIH